MKAKQLAAQLAELPDGSNVYVIEESWRDSICRLENVVVVVDPFDNRVILCTEQQTESANLMIEYGVSHI